MNNKILKIDFSSKTEHQMFKMILGFNDIIYDWKLTKSQAEILVYYLRFGYSSSTKDVILNNTDVKNRQSLNTQNNLLTNKKLIIADTKNKHNKKFCKELLNIRDFVKNNYKAILLLNTNV